MSSNRDSKDPGKKKSKPTKRTGQPRTGAAGPSQSPRTPSSRKPSGGRAVSSRSSSSRNPSKGASAAGRKGSHAAGRSAAKQTRPRSAQQVRARSAGAGKASRKSAGQPVRSSAKRAAGTPGGKGRATARRNQQLSVGARTRNEGIYTGRGSSRGNAKKGRGLFGAAAAALSAIGRALAGFFGKSRAGHILGAAIVLVAIAYCGVAAEGFATQGSVHGNVAVGDVDASGMTEEELASAIEETYGTRIGALGVTIYADEESMENQAENPEDTGDLSVEEQAAQTVCWTANESSLEASIDYEGLAALAMDAGRNGFFDRISVLVFGRTISVDVEYDESSLESLAESIDLTLGYAYIDSELTIEDGVATASESSDGVMVDRDELAEQITEQLTSANTETRQFVAVAYDTPARIDTEEGQAAADAVNAAIANGANFSYGETTWSVDSVTLGSWVRSFVMTDDDGESTLAVYFDPKRALSDISEYATAEFADGDEQISFEKDDDGDIVVKLSSEGTMPQTTSAISDLNDALFGEDADTSSAPSIEIASTSVPSEMDLKDALNVGVVSEISEYTTEYTSGAYERNTNIHLAADLLDNSIVSADGGQWSFNDIAGDCNEEKGFLSAGSIVDGELTDEIGGGICQVATTVFNAVYEAGLPFVERHNHTMYISSYPEGRDAAVSYDTLDLVWENDTDSDILVQTSYTDTSITVTLYGVSPGYTVTTETGDWEEGDEYETVYEYDESLAEGYYYVSTAGSDGHTIQVTRTVTDKSGDVVRTDTFTSVYEPTNEVIVRAGTEDDWEDEDDDE